MIEDVWIDSLSGIDGLMGGFSMGLGGWGMDSLGSLKILAHYFSLLGHSSTAHSIVLMLLS